MDMDLPLKRCKDNEIIKYIFILYIDLRQIIIQIRRKAYLK